MNWPPSTSKDLGTSDAGGWLVVGVDGNQKTQALPDPALLDAQRERIDHVPIAS